MCTFILSQRNQIAVYRDGIFRARFDDVDVEYLDAKETLYPRYRDMYQEWELPAAADEAVAE